MYCSKCGNQVENGKKFCSHCGAQVGGLNSVVVEEKVRESFNNAENEFGNAFKEVKNNLTGQAAPYTGERLQTDRGLFTYIILSLITCGIYGYYFLYKMAKDVNIACEGDGKETAGLIKFIVLSFVTCGIYTWIWYYNIGNRLAANANRYGMTFQENGTTILLWLLFGSFSTIKV